MALLLVMARNNTHPDPEKDARGCWKRGDVVEVFEDSHHDGNLVANPITDPAHVLIRITGVTKAQVEKYLQTREPGGKVKLFRFLLDDVPVGIRNQLRDNRYVSVSFTQVRNFIQNKLTLATE